MARLRGPANAVLVALPLVVAGALHAADPVQDWRRSIEGNELAFIRRHWTRIADVDLPSERGKTALMAAAARGDSALARVLIEAGADVNARNRTGGTPLIYAAAAGDEATVRLLLERGAAVDHQSVNGWSALMMAAAKGRAPLIDVLGRAGANVDLPDVYGWTPLMRAVYDGREAEVKALLRQPTIDPGRINDHGQTALHLAVIQRRPGVVRQLLARGARPDVEDFAGNTPHSIGLALGDEQVLALLHQAGRR